MRGFSILERGELVRQSSGWVRGGDAFFISITNYKTIVVNKFLFFILKSKSINFIF
jgi:hypothetical protein